MSHSAILILTGFANPETHILTYWTFWRIDWALCELDSGTSLVGSCRGMRIWCQPFTPPTIYVFCSSKYVESVR
jgi:hypothetical protein